MRNNLWALLAAAAAPVGLSASTTLLDFESEAQRAALPCVTQGVFRAGCERKGAVGGAWSFALKADPWKPGQDEWPGVDLPLKGVLDLREYDRIVVDVLALGETDDDNLSLFIAPPEGRFQDGFYAILPLVGGGFERWVIRLDKWPKTCDGSRIGRLRFYIGRPKGSEVYLDNITLYRKGEVVPPPPPMYQAMKTSGERASAERRQERLNELFALMMEGSYES